MTAGTDFPFAYLIEDQIRGHNLVVASLRELTKERMSEESWWLQQLGTSVVVTAQYSGGHTEVVPLEQYAHQTVATREEAVEFIRRRAACIAASPDPKTSLFRAQGCLRCDCDDPEEKQIADYLQTAPWEWAATPEAR